MNLEHLITDRTAQDVDRVRILAEKAWQDMTAEERSEWISPMKGSYNYTDLNRVEEAVVYVAGCLKEYGYLSSIPASRTWFRSDIPNAHDLSVFFNKVATLRKAVAVWASTPNVPNDVNGFDANQANALEQILVDIDQILNYMKGAWFFCGDLYSAEVQ